MKTTHMPKRNTEGETKIYVRVPRTLKEQLTRAALKDYRTPEGFILSVLGKTLLPEEVNTSTKTEQG